MKYIKITDKKGNITVTSFSALTNMYLIPKLDEITIDRQILHVKDSLSIFNALLLFLNNDDVEFEINSLN